MLNHVALQFPDEAVGLIGGSSNGDVKMIVPLPNKFQGNRFFVDPYIQYLAIKEIKTNTALPIAVYHSHPDGPAILSLSDRQYAANTPYIQLIIAFDGQATQMRAYKVEANLEVIELTITIK